MTTGIGVNKASEFTPQDFERLLVRTLSAVKKGDFTARMPVDFTGTAGKIADLLNEIVEMQERSTSEIERISTVVGKEGKLNQRCQLPAAGGSWSTVCESINGG